MISTTSTWRRAAAVLSLIFSSNSPSVSAMHCSIPRSMSDPATITAARRLTHSSKPELESGSIWGAYGDREFE